MKTKLSIILSLSIVFILVFATGCELPGGKNSQEPVVIVVTATPSDSGGGNVVVTEPPAPPATEPPPPAATEPPAPPATEPPVTDAKFFTEDFSTGLDNYTTFQINEAGRLLNSITERAVVKAEGNKLRFNFNGKDIWYYAVYNKVEYDNVKVELEIENQGVNSQRVALVCRYSKDLGFYEFDISGGGLWELYYYDALMSKGYKQIDNGGSEFIKMGKDTNVYAMSCVDDKISLFINGNLIKTVKSKDLKSGQAGFGVSSFNALPVIMNINYVKYSEPD